MLVNILTSIFVWGIGCICLLQLCTSAGLFPSLKKKSKIFNLKSIHYPSYQPTTRDFLKIFFYAIAFRMVIHLFSALIRGVFFSSDQPLTLEQIINKWVLWDANNYIRITTVGYGGYWENGMATTLVFFPLYSWLMKIVNSIIPSINLTGLVTSALCYAVGCAYFYGAVCLDYGKSIAKKTIILISIFPFGFFLGAIMPESTFFMVAAACFYYIKKHNWPLAALFGALAALSRMQGILLAIPAAIEWLTYYKPILMLKKKRFSLFWKIFLTKAMWIPFMITGTLIYLYQNYLITGNPFQFLEYQEKVWYQTPQYFGKTVSQIWSRAFIENSGDIKFQIWIPEIMIFIFTIAMLVYGIKKHSVKYTSFLLLYTVMNYTPSWLLSAGRYMSVALPLFLILAEFLDKKEKLWTGFLVGFSMLFAIYLCGYLSYLQIF